MYKVFLVEDEIVAREGIRNSINWDSTNFVFSGEASDGEMALQMIQEIKPDILVTDIKMPFMDGLQLSGYIRKNMPWVKVIIISGHDEFNFAREALSIGVTEYLLKPISSIQLMEVFNKVSEQIEAERKEMEDIESLKRQVDNNKQIFRDKFLNELSIGLVSSLEAIDKAVQLNLNIISKYYLVEIIESDLRNTSNSNDEYSEYIKVESIISNLVTGNPDIIKFKRNMEESVLIFRGDSPDNLEEAAYSIAQAIKYEVERNTSSLISIGIGSVQERISGISKSFRDAESAKSYKYIFGKNKITGIKDIRADGFDSKELLKIEKNSMMDFLKSGNKSGIPVFFDTYFSIVDVSGMKSTIYLYYIYMNIVLDITRFVYELGGKAETLIPEIAEIENLLDHIESKDRFINKIQGIVMRVLEYRDKKIVNKYESIIRSAKSFINSKYSDPNISLNMVAGHVNVSPSHFSTIFSQETGETFIEYLTRVRIKKAMELLKTTMLKASVIGYSIGYNDPHYFSYIFKKVAGITPKEFRNDE